MQRLALLSVRNGRYLSCFRFTLIIIFLKNLNFRSAIAKAVSDGHREFTAIAVVAMQEKFFTSPCGVCRQTLTEFARKDFPVYIAKPAACRVLITSVQKLLPGAFQPTFIEDNLNFKR